MIKKAFGVISVTLGGILTPFSLFCVVWYAVAWDRLQTLAGSYQIQTYLIYVIGLVIGCALLWVGKYKLLRSK